MTDIHYRVLFNNKSATQEELDRIKEIAVEQEVDMAWEARIHILIYADERGRWTGENEAFMAPYSRVRLEVKTGKNGFVPLIDGPVVGFDSHMSSEPGQSSITLIVHDDSVYLNRRDDFQQFENKTDTEIVREIFDQSTHIASTDIASIPSNPKMPVVVQKGTPMQVLRVLAKLHGMHAYVLPGKRPGESIGCFKPFPTQTDGLDPLILMGEKRNISTFSVKNEASRPAMFTASSLSITDKVVITRTASFRDSTLLGQEPSLEDEGNEALQILRNDVDPTADMDQLVAAQAANSSYSFEATGSVNRCYQNVMQPYRVVTTLGANARLSGDYLISQVTHNLTESLYSQSFSLKRNARSGGSQDNLGDFLAGSIF
jgi:hypothetical protein